MLWIGNIWAGFAARRLAADTRAAAMFEFAVAVPILIFLFAGGYEFARALWQYDLASKGVRDAARYLARVADPTSATSQSIATNLVLRGSIGEDAPLRLDPANVSVAVTKQTYDNTDAIYRGPDGEASDIDVVTVQAQMNYEGALLGFLKIDNSLTFRVGNSQRHLKDG